MNIKDVSPTFFGKCVPHSGRTTLCVPEDATLSITPNHVLLCLTKPSQKRT